jgi:hypothetical protein
MNLSLKSNLNRKVAHIGGSYPTDEPIVFGKFSLIGIPTF